jgi:hypothetical protein
VESLVTFAEDGSIVDRLNEFKEKDSWRGPTLGGLVAALEAAVASYPNMFLPLLSTFHGAKLPFQHALLGGLKRVFDQSSEPKPEFDWGIAWPKLMTFFSECLGDPAFWNSTPEENLNLIPNRTWMTTAIAGFLEAGTKNDETAYDPDARSQHRERQDHWCDVQSRAARLPARQSTEKINSGGLGLASRRFRQ